MDIEVAGAEVFAHLPAYIFDNNRWKHAQDLDGKIEGNSHILAGVTGLLQKLNTERSPEFILVSIISRFLEESLSFR